MMIWLAEPISMSRAINTHERRIQLSPLPKKKNFYSYNSAINTAALTFNASSGESERQSRT